MTDRWLILLFVSVLSACANAPPPPEDHFYRLPVPRADRGQALTHGSLRVEEFEVSGLLRDRAIIYTRGDDSVELDQYYYHFWHVSPGQLIQNHLAVFLENAAAAPVVTTGRTAAADLTVTGRIDELLQVRQSRGGHVVVSLELRLLRRDRTAPLLIKKYTVKREASGSMDRVVTRFGDALKAIYAEFLADARQTI